jgi:hypothetical protein
MDAKPNPKLAEDRAAMAEIHRQLAAEHDPAKRDILQDAAASIAQAYLDLGEDDEAMG